jgi:hypothetical protein
MWMIFKNGMGKIWRKSGQNEMINKKIFPLKIKIARKSYLCVNYIYSNKGVLIVFTLFFRKNSNKII